MTVYTPKRESQSQFLPIRGLQYHLRTWAEGGSNGGSDKTPLVMVHGWMDVSASFQFVVDALSDDFIQGRTVVSPDWRGYGLSVVPGCGNYWFPDYMADLDFILDHLEATTGHTQFDLVGHSMGGNVAMVYAGVRPERIRRLINLEGFGMAQTRPENAGKRYAQWMGELKNFHAGKLDLASYESRDGVAKRLMKNNLRLTEDKADWLAGHWGAPNLEGRWEIQGDAAHKIVNAQLYRVDETQAIFKQITAPTLCVEAQDNSLDKWWAGKYTLDQYHKRLQAVPNCKIEAVADAGHMMHHDQPEVLAGLIEGFLR